MKSKKRISEYGFEIEPFYKRWWDDISDWFVRKGIEIKTNFLSYIRSKETHKKWKRWAVVIGIVILIALSFRVKNYFNLWPFDENSYLIITEDRDKLTNYGGSEDYSRLTSFIKNVNNQIEDKIRVVHSESGYNIIEDLEFDGKTLTITTDNRKNNIIPKSQRIKTTVEYESCKITIASAVEEYIFIDTKGESYVFATRSLK